MSIIGSTSGLRLGPLLFSMYICHLSQIASAWNQNTHQYADDCQLYVAFKPANQSSTTSAQENIEGCVNNIRQWMANNRLKLNDDKTEILVLRSPRLKHRVTLSTISIGEVEVEPSPRARNLGCFFDHSMNMELQVNNICKSSYYHLRNISAIRSSLTRNAAEKLVHAFISSRLDNCNSLLCNLPASLLTKLQRVQNTAARIVTRKGRKCDINNVLQELHWLPVQQRIAFKVLTITWKALHGQAPSYITDLLTPYVPVRSLRSVDQELLSVPVTRNSYGDRAFSSTAPRLWNSMPLSVRHVSNYDTFKSTLKTHLFRVAYKL